MTRALIVSSAISEPGMTPAGVAYVATVLNHYGIAFDILDLSGTIDYVDAPEELYVPCNSKDWLNPQAIANAHWIDPFLPHHDDDYDYYFYSSMFSPDMVFHARHSLTTKRKRNDATTVVGGTALAGLSPEQISIVQTYFDFICVGYDVHRLVTDVLSSKPSIGYRSGGHQLFASGPPRSLPDYSLIDLKDFVTVYAGHGCYYSKCRFCDYPARASNQVYFRDSVEVAQDVWNVFLRNPNVTDVVLALDAYPERHLKRTANALLKNENSVPYNLMLRAEPWIDRELGRLLGESGCTDVFIGAEAFDDDILAIMDKGVTAKNTDRAVTALADYVDVTIGLVLFVPGVSSRSLKRQLSQLEAVLPYLESIEPEVLTVVRGSQFAKDPKRFGIVTYVTEQSLNDSWCFGLSQDIPWTFEDPGQAELWFEHVVALKELCGGLVNERYWAAIEEVRGEWSR